MAMTSDHSDRAEEDVLDALRQAHDALDVEALRQLVSWRRETTEWACRRLLARDEIRETNGGYRLSTLAADGGEVDDERGER